jgi:hypothetical protein
LAELAATAVQAMESARVTAAKAKRSRYEWEFMRDVLCWVIVRSAASNGEVEGPATSARLEPRAHNSS